MTLDRHQLDFHTVETFGDADVDHTFALPGAHPIAAIMLEWNLEDSAANVESAIDAIDVEIAGNSLLGRISGEQLRSLVEWHRGRASAAPAAGLTETQRLYIPFARFGGDGQFGLPADRFNARLIFQGSRTTSDTQNEVRVFVEQMVGMGGRGMVVPKVSQPDSEEVDGGEDWQLEGNPGRRLSALYVDADNEDLLAGSRVEVHNNNRQETVYEVDHEVHDEWMLQERQIIDDTIPAGFLAFPYDRQRALEAAVPTGRDSPLRDFTVEGTADGAAATGDVNLLQEDYVVLAPAEN